VRAKPRGVLPRAAVFLQPRLVIEGRRVVLGIYAAVVCISAVVGGAVPAILPEIGQPQLFGFLPLPATTVGYALFGGLTTAALLGAGLLLVELTSRAEAE